ncbi:MAG: ABC transporter ATP-binding protein [Nitrospirae bacterium]|nr:ABC transporter ATP-binding protein [Nitrospirota bacterium]
MTSAIIDVKNLRKSFNTKAGGLEVLRGINVAVKSGEVVSIMGASGVGKSTFLHCLGTLDRPTSGEVSIGGKLVFELDDNKLASFRNRSIGFVFQFHHLLPEFTALENTMMPGLIAGVPLADLQDKARNLLTELGLQGRLTHRPGELSGGEQQRVAVARSLILEPVVVLADEPTGNLDTKTGAHLMDLIMDINAKKGTTFIIVTHNEAFAKKGHKIYYMVDGTLQ